MSKLWGAMAEEELPDRRKTGPLLRARLLMSAATASAQAGLGDRYRRRTVQAAMTAFMGKYLKDLLAHAPYAPTQQTEFRAWSKQFAHWLFGTDHIMVRYEISYDGVDIRKPSPGTRGHRAAAALSGARTIPTIAPLIIDQPEENLDPKSGVRRAGGALFIAAKTKRQVVLSRTTPTSSSTPMRTRSSWPRRARILRAGFRRSATRQAAWRTRLFARRYVTFLEGGEAAFARSGEQARACIWSDRASSDGARNAAGPVRLSRLLSDSAAERGWTRMSAEYPTQAEILPVNAGRLGTLLGTLTARRGRRDEEISSAPTIQSKATSTIPQRTLAESLQRTAVPRRSSSHRPRPCRYLPLG